MSVPSPAPHPGYWSPNTAPRFGGPGRAPANTFAWLGLIISVSGFIFPLGVNGLLGAAFSLVGLRDARRLADAGHSETGRSLAVAGLIVGVVYTIVVIGAIVLAVLAYTWFTTWLDDLTTRLQTSTLS